MYLVRTKIDLHEKDSDTEKKNKKLLQSFDIKSHLSCSSYVDEPEWRVNRAFESAILVSLQSKGLMSKREAKRVKAVDFKLSEAKVIIGRYTDADVEKLFSTFIDCMKVRETYDDQKYFLSMDFVIPEENEAFWFEEKLEKIRSLNLE